MITPGQEMHLGRSAFYLMATKRMFYGIVLFLVAFALFTVSGPLISAGTGLATMASTPKAQAMATAASVVNGGVLVLFVVSLLICLVGVIVARLEYGNYTYTLGEFNLIMKKGILNKMENSIPYRQIQDVDIERNLGHQLLGLSRLVMQTAGHEESTEHEMAEIVLEPIGKKEAEEIRALLQRKIGVQIVQTEEVADKEMAGEGPTGNTIK